MQILWFGVLGLGLGYFLDALIERLAVPFDDDQDDEGPEESAAPAGNETGSLVISESTVHWPRRAVIMAATGGLFTLAAARYDEPTQQVVVAAYAAVLLICATTDILVYRVPNVVTYPAMLGAIAAGVLIPDANFWDVLAGGALAGFVLFVPALLTGGSGMGMGDVKLATFVGLAVGFAFAGPAMMVMALTGGAFAALLLVTRMRKKGQPIPYAPFISAGGLAAMFLLGTSFATAG